MVPEATPTKAPSRRVSPGPAGPAAPYRLRRHAEVRGGAVPEVHYRIGQKVTFTKLVHLETLLVFTGTIIEVPEVPAPGMTWKDLAKINRAGFERTFVVIHAGQGKAVVDDLDGILHVAAADHDGARHLVSLQGADYGAEAHVVLRFVLLNLGPELEVVTPCAHPNTTQGDQSQPNGDDCARSGPAAT